MNRPDARPVALLDASFGVLLTSHPSSPSSSRSPEMILGHGAAQGPIPRHHWSPEYPPCNNILPPANSGMPHVSSSASQDGRSLPAASLPVADDVELLLENSARPYVPMAVVPNPRQPPAAHENTSIQGPPQSQTLSPNLYRTMRGKDDTITNNYLGRSQNSYGCRDFRYLDPELTVCYSRPPSITPYDERTLQGHNYHGSGHRFHGKCSLCQCAAQFESPRISC
jgi:hypothetical protein